MKNGNMMVLADGKELQAGKARPVIGKMLAYVAVFLLMALWSVGHLAGCAGAALFLLFAGAAVIFTKAKRS